MKFEFIDNYFERKANLVIHFKLDEKNFYFKGSYVLLNKESSIICCTEDVFCKKNNKLSFFKHKNRIKELSHYIKKNDLKDCKVFSINSYDYLLDFFDYKLILFSDRVDDHNSSLLMEDKPLFFSVKISNKDLKKIENRMLLSIDYYFNFNHIVLEFNELKLYVNCYFKILQDSHFIFSSYSLREKYFEGHFEFLERLLKNKMLIRIEEYEKCIFKLLFSDNIELYIFIDNRFKGNHNLTVS